LEEVSIGDLGRMVKVGSQLDGELIAHLVAFLQDNTDVLAWSHKDMPGIDPSWFTMWISITSQLNRK